MIGLLLAGAVLTAQASELPPAPPAPPASISRETFYGTEIDDPFREFESLDESTITWIKQDGRYSRLVLDAIPRRNALLRRLSAFHSQFAALGSYQSAGGRTFFTRRGAGADDFDLFVREGNSTRKVVDLHRIRAANGAVAYAINYFLASPDGSKVAVGISKAGTENALLSVYDVHAGSIIGNSIDRAEFGFLAWSDDSSTIYMNRLQAPRAGQMDRYTNSTVDSWDLHSAPKTIVDRSLLSAAGLAPTDTPQLILSPTAALAALRIQNGAEQNIAIWLAPKADVGSPQAWRPFVSHRDGVTAFELSGGKIFLLSNEAAPTFKILEVDAGMPLTSARTILSAAPDRIIESIHATSEGLYVVARRGLYASMLSIKNDGSVQELKLPTEGRISAAFSSPERPGITIAFESWNLPSALYGYNAGTGKFSNLGLASPPPAGFAKAAVQDLQAPGADGAMIPLTVMTPPAPRVATAMLLTAYGSYGISLLPSFNPLVASFIDEGGSYAVCHVRGGGELGEAWRLGGKDANKSNTWRDLIACSENLIARGLAVKGRLFIYGSSGGGIAVGRAATERPDLFAGVIDNVPPANMTRMEFMPEGALETQEFGSIKTEAGFRNLLAMDTYQHVERDVRYPPFLISMGLNDPRVAPWQPAKLAARLQAAGKTVVLLRVDLENGHGVGSTRAQVDELYADFFSFVFWLSGRPGWQPHFSAIGVK